jgi:tRNA-splicing ligase RtcB
MSKHNALSSLKRQSANISILENPRKISVRVCANSEVPIEENAVTELLSLLEVQDTLSTVGGKLNEICVTPDFHKGAGIPIGTVISTTAAIIPAAIGKDINCGMRVHTTSFSSASVKSNLNKLEQKLRHLYFEGGRNIPMTRIQREALLQDGLLGLLLASKKHTEGQWGSFNRFTERDIEKVENLGSYHADTIIPELEDFLNATRDGQIASIGGGNHFVEIQEVTKILDAPRAHAQGLKKGTVVIMVHSGSVALGHLAGDLNKQLALKAYPKNLKHPENKIFALSSDNKPFWNNLHNAVNFAFANRLFLAMLSFEALEDCCGPGDCKLVYDSPHNMIWKNGDHFIHRKGACPAHENQPVMVPGSMGDSSYLLHGLGNPESLWSASHGAGRSVSRGETLKVSEEAFQKFLKEFRIVTPVDLNRPDIKARRDITDKKLAELRQEAPFAYKPIRPVIDSLADIASPVAEMKPILTVKG